jgi:opacity protein-like surface antigen
MKKLFLLTLIFASATTFAQFYASLGAGYSMGMPKSVLGYEETSTSVKNIYGTYGTGVNGKLNLGYFLNDNLGVELGFTYLMGSDQLIESEVDGSYNLKVNAQATAIGLAPTLIYKWDNGLYGKFGFATKVGGKVVENYDVKSGSYTMTETMEYVNKTPLGFTGALGYQFEIGTNMNLFLEMEYLGINVKRDKATMTAYEMKYNGTVVETLADLTAIDRETIFVDELTDSSPENHELTEMSPYSSLGFNVGIRYTFGQ